MPKQPEKEMFYDFAPKQLEEQFFEAKIKDHSFRAYLRAEIVLSHKPEKGNMEALTVHELDTGDLYVVLKNKRIAFPHLVKAFMVYGDRLMIKYGTNSNKTSHLNIDGLPIEYTHTEEISRKKQLLLFFLIQRTTMKKTDWNQAWSMFWMECLSHGQKLHVTQLIDLQ